jgi:hypothetical protein
MPSLQSELFDVIVFDVFCSEVRVNIVSSIPTDNLFF